MKIGQQVPVNLDEHVVAHAVVEDIEDDIVTLVIPATRIRMGMSSRLTDLPEQEPETERILLGTDDSSSEQSQAQAAVVEPKVESQVAQTQAETGGRSLKEVQLDSSVLDD